MKPMKMKHMKMKHMKTTGTMTRLSYLAPLVCKRLLLDLARPRIHLGQCLH